MVGGVFIATCCKSGQFEGENEVVRPRFHIRQDLNKVHAVVFWLKREKKVVLVVVKKLTFFGTIAPYNHKMWNTLVKCRNTKTVGQYSYYGGRGKF